MFNMIALTHIIYLYAEFGWLGTDVCIITMSRQLKLMNVVHTCSCNGLQVVDSGLVCQQYAEWDITLACSIEKFGQIMVFTMYTFCYINKGSATFVYLVVCGNYSCTEMAAILLLLLLTIGVSEGQFGSS